MNNCRNCGAASMSKGRCDYCWSLDPQYAKDAETIAVAYFSGFIGDEQRNELIEQLGMNILMTGTTTFLRHEDCLTHIPRTQAG
jgi:hypothetical protein